MDHEQRLIGADVSFEHVEVFDGVVLAVAYPADIVVPARTSTAAVAKLRRTYVI